MNLIKKALFKDKFNKVSEEASIQSDWEQNDSNANDYIKNRPFYETDYIITSADIEINFDSDKQGFDWVNNDLPTANFDKTKEYKIIFDGQEYYSQIKSGYAKAVGSYLYLGNALPWDSRFNDEYPFCIYCPNPKTVSENILEIGFSVNPIKNETINCFVEIIDTSKKNVKKIDPKFIPNMQIIPINENNDMTLNDLMNLPNGIYMAQCDIFIGSYNDISRYVVGLFKKLDDFIDNYNYGYIFFQDGDSNWVLDYVESFTPMAESNIFGGFLANKTDENYKTEVKIGDDGRLYIPDLNKKLDKRLGEEYAYKILATDEYGTIVAEERDIIRDDNISTGQILDLPKGIYYFKNLHEVYGTNGQYFLLNGLCKISDLSGNYKLFTLYDYGMKYRIDNNKAIVDMTPIYNQDIDYVINSSTEGSTKKFKITVDDSGIISATEVV